MKGGRGGDALDSWFYFCWVGLVGGKGGFMCFGSVLASGSWLFEMV